MNTYGPVLFGLTLCGIHWSIAGAFGAEKAWRSIKNYPQQRFVARPIYKFVASHSNPVIGAAASFLLTDLIAHQLLGQALTCILNNVLNYPSSCKIRWDPQLSLAWLAVGLPVMYAKYCNSSERDQKNEGK